MIRNIATTAVAVVGIWKFCERKVSLPAALLLEGVHHDDTRVKVRYHTVYTAGIYTYI